MWAMILLCSCSHPSVNRQLEAAEAIMEQHPDSALTILEAIDGSRLRGEPRARYAMLHIIYRLNIQPKKR